MVDPDRAVPLEEVSELLFIRGGFPESLGSDPDGRVLATRRTAPRNTWSTQGTCIAVVSSMNWQRTGYSKITDVPIAPVDGGGNTGNRVRIVLITRLRVTRLYGSPIADRYFEFFFVASTKS